ncbi:class I SAM-dependent methyltransferase [Roseibium sp. HPY-6]|uniref:class I SAM-dependent methyltransferase n=1 Tax=Roseibium sp. HPY-6 TaxID=3229852 RepID=UPI00338EF34F
MSCDLSIPDRFDNVVEMYSAFRTRYAPDLIDWLLAETQTGKVAHVLDLGCGPGFIANALGSRVARVTGVDPSASMLAAAEAEAPDNVTYVEGSSEDLSIVEGPIDLVTMGRSFHWMDRPATLRDLDTLVAQNGALAFLDDKPIKAPKNRWWWAIQEVGKAHARPDPTSLHRMTDAWEPHETVLLASPFSDLRRISVLARHSWTYDSLLGHFLSRSACTPEVLGSKGLAAFEAALKDALSPFGKGPFETLNDHVALIARRPGHR